MSFGCDTVSLVEQLPTFRPIVVLPLSRSSNRRTLLGPEDEDTGSSKRRTIHTQQHSITSKQS